MRTFIAAIVAALTVTVGAIANAGTGELPACVHEDGSGGPTPCFWDAAERGNGQGRSFVMDANRNVSYVD